MTERGPGWLHAAALVGSGGFVGSVLRHGVTVALPTTAIATLAVNVVGSFALAFVLSESSLGRRLHSRGRLAFGTGLLSSFTTYSTFALATAALAPSWAILNVAANYGLAILAVLLAHTLARWDR